MEIQEKFQFLKDFTWKLKYADAKERLNSIGQITDVAHSIGIDRTTEELLPFLQILISQCEDLECLKSFLEQLIKLAHFLAGSHNVHQLLPTLELLLKRDEEVVQKRALDCLKLYAKDVNVTSFEIHFKPHLHRLSTDNCVSTRRLVCCLYSSYYARLPFALKDDLLNDYGHLCGDIAACVRKSAVMCMGELSKMVDFERLRSNIIPLFVALAEDESDSVRVACIDAFIGICGKLIPRNVEQFLIPPMLKLFDDKSYRVRLKTARTIKELQRAVGPSMSKSFLVPTLSKYFTDPITDVRTASIDRAVDFCGNLEYNARIQFLSEFLLPQLEGLYSDPCSKVRAAVCDFIKLAQFLPLDGVKKHFAPAILTLLHDECHSVQSAAAAHLRCIRQAVDVAVLSNSVNAEMLIAIKLNKFEKLLKIVDAIPFYVSALGEDFMDEKLMENIIRAEANHKSALIRMVALNAVKKCVNILGIQWTEKCLLPQLTNLLKKESSRSDRQCFTWAQVTLSGLPEAIANEKVLDYLEELNKRNWVDKSELRSIVFRAIQLAKKNIDQSSLKMTIEKLESSLFSELSDKEYLQFALTQSAEINEDLTLPEILVEPAVNGEVKLRRKKFQDPEDKSKRFSLPATPLFDFNSSSGTNINNNMNFLNVSSYDLSVSSKRSLNLARVRSTSYSRISEIDSTETEVLNAKLEKVAAEPAPSSNVENDASKFEVELKKNEEESKLVKNEIEENEPFELIAESEYENLAAKVLKTGEEISQMTAEQSHGTAEVRVEVPEININEKQEFENSSAEEKIETKVKEISTEEANNFKQEKLFNVEAVLVPKINTNERRGISDLTEEIILETDVKLNEISVEESHYLHSNTEGVQLSPEIISTEKQAFYDSEEQIVAEPKINHTVLLSSEPENYEEVITSSVETGSRSEKDAENERDVRLFESVSESKSEESNEEPEVFVDVVEEVVSSESEEDKEYNRKRKTVIDDVMVETESVSDSSEDLSQETAATSGEVGEDEQFLDAEEIEAKERVNGFIEPEVEEKDEQEVGGKVVQNASEFRMTNFLIDFNDDEIDV